MTFITHRLVTPIYSALLFRGKAISKLNVLLAAGVLSASVFAQTAAPTSDDRNKAKQEQVKSATAATAKGYAGSAAEGSAAAAKTKSMPRTAPDAASKQAAVKSATAGTAKGYSGAAAEQSAKAAADKSPRPPKVKAQAGTPELNKVVP